MTNFYCVSILCLGFPGGSVVKNQPANAGDTGSIPGPGRHPGEGNGNPIWYSCLGNHMDRGAWWATVHGVTKSQMQLKNKNNNNNHYVLGLALQLNTSFFECFVK